MRIYYLLLFCSSALFSQHDNVGIRTTTPLQRLHVASSTGTIRVDGFNYINNSNNEGDVNGDLDLSNDIFPLYVNNIGNLDLSFTPFISTEDGDSFDHTTLVNNTITLPSSDADGIETSEIISYTITVTRTTIVEVKYNISFDIYEDASKTIISDNLARRIYTYINVTGQTRHYASTTKNYSSGATNSSPGNLYTNGKTYITLPTAGTYDIKLMGAISSDIKGNGGGTTSKNTYVEFATGNDSLFIKLH